MVIVAGGWGPCRLELAFAAGVTDWLTQPLLSGVHPVAAAFWLRRMRVGWLKPPLPQ